MKKEELTVNKLRNKQFTKKGFAFGIGGLVLIMLSLLVVVVINAETDITRPMILSVLPENNQEISPRNELITVVFSENMEPSTINTDTFTVTQRTTPKFANYFASYRSRAIDGTIVYIDRGTNHIATFSPNSLLSPNQEYGNVFTVTITTGAKDLVGNSLSQDYMWSFTTGSDPFNKDATTSQLDQSQTAIPETGSIPAQTSTEVTTTEATAAEVTPMGFRWVWLVGILLVLLLGALLFGFFMLPTRQKNVKVVHTKQVENNPFGDIHPVIDIEGIGPEYNQGLQTMGIKDTEQLWKADSSKVAHETGASVNAVKSWQHMAELTSVKDIGPQYAELLERSGVHSIGQLKHFNPDKLLKLVREKQDSLKIRIQGNFPGLDMVKHWISAANAHKYKAS